MAQFHVLHSGLQNKICLGKILFGGCHSDALYQSGGLLCSQFTARHLCLLIDGNDAPRLFKAPFGNIVKNDLIAVLGKDLGERGTHYAGTG